MQLQLGASGFKCVCEELASIANFLINITASEVVYNVIAVVILNLFLSKSGALRFKVD